MSLEQLLKDGREAPAWTLHRRKLIRFLSGLGIMIGGLITLAALIFSSTSHHASARLSAEEAPEKKEEAPAQELAELMRLQQKTAELKDQIDSLRTGARGRGGSGYGAGSDSFAGRAQAAALNYDPGTGFVDLKKDSHEAYIPTGSVFQAQLLTPIKTSVERTFVMAEVTEEYRMDSKRRIPKGSRLIGRSRLNSVLKSVIVEFETLVLPEGIETSIAGMALSRNALPEIEGLYFSNRNVTYGTALAFGFLSGYADSARSRQLTFYGAVPEVSVENQVLGGLSAASFQVANEILQDIRARAIEYVVVPAGERVFVALTRRYEMNQKEAKK